MCQVDDLPYWLRYVSALSVICIPLVGAIIAFRQTKIQNIELKHQLYDRRFKIYDATRDFLKGILSTGAVDNVAYSTFVIATADAAFVFDTSIQAFLKDVIRHGAALLTFGPIVAQNLGLGVAAAPGQPDYVKLKTDAQLALNSIFDQLETKFLPFMQLERPSLFARIISKRVF